MVKNKRRLTLSCCCLLLQSLLGGVSSVQAQTVGSGISADAQSVYRSSVSTTISTIANSGGLTNGYSGSNPPPRTRDDGLTSLLTPFSDVIWGGLGKVHIVLGRNGNDLIYGYNQGFAPSTRLASYIDVILADVFDLYIIQPNYRDDLIRNNPLSILQIGPPVAGRDQIILGDWRETYYTNPNFFQLLSDYGSDSYALILDFNPNQDTIQLRGSSSDYQLVDLGSIDVPPLGTVSGRALVYLGGGFPDLIGYIVATPTVPLSLDGPYFRYEGTAPPPGPVSTDFYQFGTGQLDVATASEVDSQDNLIVTGLTSGSLGGPNQGSYDAWVAKFDKSGNQLSIQQFGSPNEDAAYSIAVDRADNNKYYLGGGSQGDLFGPASLTTGYDYAWVAKFDPSGNRIWNWQYGADILTGSRGIKLDNRGNLFVSGLTVKQNLDPNFQFNIQDDSWIARLDTNGNQRWFTELGGPAFNENYTIAVSPDGNNIFTAGWTYGITQTSVANGTLYDGFMARLNSSGSLFRIKQFGTPGFDFPWESSTDSLGNFYVTGNTSGSFVGGGRPNNNGTQNGSADTFLAKFSPNGSQLWVRQLGTDGDDGQFLPRMKISAKDGGVYILGFSNSNLGGPNAGGFDAWLAKYDQSGNRLWIRQWGTAKNDYPSSIAEDSTGSIYVTGYTDGSLGGPNAGSLDVWIARFDSNGNRLPFKR